MPLDSSDHPIVSNLPPCRNIVIFGEVGVGKSSVVNLIAGEERAITSSGVKSCTQRSEEHVISFGSIHFSLHDTVGLQDSAGKKKQIIPSAVSQAYTLKSRLENAGGVHLLLFCMKGGGRISTMAQQAYSLFVDVLCNRQVPVIIVVTHLETYSCMEDWWLKMEKGIKEYGLDSVGHACITATRGYKNRLEDRYRRSRDEVVKLLLQYSDLKSAETIRIHHDRPRYTQWSILPRRSDVHNVSQIQRSLIDRYGFPADWARDLARRTQTSSGDIVLNVENSGGSLALLSSTSLCDGHRDIEHTSPLSGDQLRSGIPKGTLISLPNVVDSASYTPFGTDQNSSRYQYNFPYEDLTSRISGKGSYPTLYGAYGDIWKCDLICGATTQKVAVKAVRPLGGESAVVEKKLRREMKIWARLRHENVVPLFGVASGFGPLPSMVCPWIENGSLSGYLKRWDASLGIVHRLALLHDVAAGLQYLHSHEMSIVHGDIHSDNILIDKHGKALLSDFGLSLIIQEFLGTPYLQSSVHGCMRFAAPELFAPSEAGQGVLVYPTSSSDVYSFGCVVLHVLSSEKPFNGMASTMILVKLTQGERPPVPKDQELQADHHAFIQRCWAGADERPSAEEVVAFTHAQLTSSLILCKQWTGPGSRPIFPC